MVAVVHVFLTPRWVVPSFTSVPSPYFFPHPWPLCSEITNQGTECQHVHAVIVPGDRRGRSL